MKKHLSKIILGFVLTFVFGNFLWAQESGVITGTVFPAGMQTPVKDAVVTVKGADLPPVHTDINGFFKLKVNSFPVVIEINKPGYRKETVTVEKENDLTVHLFGLNVKNDYGKSVAVRVSLNPESRDGILMFSSSDNRFKYWFDNRVYVDGAAYFGDNADIGNGVNIRRMRFAMKTILWGHWGGEIDFDFAYNEVDIKDAFVRYIGDNNWQVKAGNFKEPFSMEETTTSRYVTFIERPMITKLTPSRHLGISFRKFGHRYFAEAGLFSSEIVNDLMQDQNKKQGTSAGWSATGRMAYAPVKTRDMVLHFGLAGSYRTPKIPELGDPVNSFRFSSRAETSINRKKYVDTDDISDSKSMILYGFETAFVYKNFKIAGEYIGSKIQRDETKTAVGEDKAYINGFFINGGWLITNADYYYNMAEAEFSQINFRNYNKGVLEFALRYSFTDANSFKDGSDIPYIPGGSCEIYTAGLNYYFNYNVKIMLDYSYVNNDRWADGKGKYDTYKDMPTGKAGIDFGMLQARIEIDF
jgi:phosphate-selective porin OprO/OprP